MKTIYTVTEDEFETVWMLDGKIHRTDGPACEHVNGSKWWYQHGKQHRTDGPACEFSDGSKSWYQHGKRHRTDGPACEFSDGSKCWYIDGKNLTEKQFLAQTNSKLCAEGKVVEVDGVKYTLVKV